MAEDEQQNSQDGNSGSVTVPSRLFLKDVSFETPNTPEIFSLDWKPNVLIDFTNNTRDLGDDTYEVTLATTVTVTVEDKTAYLAEIHQAGVFILKGFSPEALKRVQHVFCLQYLYPYVCAVVTDLISKGGFPQLLLGPMNFKMIYARRQADADEPAEAPSGQPA